MSAAPNEAQPPILEAPSPKRALRQLFLTLFLRGRTSRGLQKAGAPTSIGSKLALTLAVYALFGLAAFLFWFQSIFALSAWLHSMTFVFLGMFVAASSGEILFNKEEADILLHRPVPPRDMLWAKIRVLVEVSLWMSGALNLASFIIGMLMPAGAWLFPIAHAISITLEALFSTGCVVVAYQLCLRWFGRERLDSLMTAAQVMVAIATALSGQIVPQLIGSFQGKLDFGMKTWWLGLLPPVWFASLDDALTGTGSLGSWALAGLGVLATAAVLSIAFGKLAGDYERGLQALNESTAAPRRTAAGRRWFDRLVNYPPLSWWLRNSVARAAFLLTAAYLLRDRDTKLRVYPGLAPALAFPLLLLFQGREGAFGSAFGAALIGSYAALAAPLALSAVQYSQQWQASDIFRAAPMPGPAELCHGARRAVLVVITLPLLVVFGVIASLLTPRADWQLMLPGLIALPVFALVPGVNGGAVPLSRPSEDARAAAGAWKTVAVILGVLLSSFGVSGLGALARYLGWFWWYVGAETFVVAALYFLLRAWMAKLRWRPIE